MPTYQCEVENIIDIQSPGSGFTGWPTMIKTASGELLAVYSGGRQHHGDPFGQIHLIRSRDGGRTWTWPRILVDSVTDDRDPGILETPDGSLVVTWMSSFRWEVLMQEGCERSDIFEGLCEEERAEWRRRKALFTDELRERELGVWSIRSTDGGATWSPRIPTRVHATHGPCALNDGRLLYVGNEKIERMDQSRAGNALQGKISVAHSTNDGQSWEIIAELPTAPEQEPGRYFEIHATQAAGGAIIAHIRNHNALHYLDVMQTESHDGGYTWTVPHPIGVWGYPASLLKTSDGRLIASIGHRREPKGNQISISDDDGQNWSPQQPLNSDSDIDFGYPTTVELEAGYFATMWYDHKDHERAYLRVAQWRLVTAP